MNKKYLSRWSLVAPALTSLCLAPLYGQSQEADALIELEPVVVIGERAAEKLSESTTSISLVDGDESHKKGYRTLQDTLDRLPGVHATSTAGQRGQTGSLFIRGATTAQVNVQVDGIRLTNSSFANGNFLSQQTFGSGERLEVLRGGLSSLHGSESIGGVLALSLKKGEGAPSLQTFVEAGSFETFNGQITSQGREGDFSWNLKVEAEMTDHDVDHTKSQDFKRLGSALRLDYDINDRLSIGGTFRFSDSTLHQVDSTNDVDTVFATVFATLNVNDRISSTLRFGHYDEGYQNVSSYGVYSSDVSKNVLSWENLINWSGQNQTVAGFVYEDVETYRSSDGFDPNAGLYGFYLNHIWDPTDTTRISAGIRWEDYEEWKDITTWRVSARQKLISDSLSVKGTIARSFGAPTLLQLLGFGAEPGNPDLNPQSADNFELGLEAKISDDVFASAIWFRSNVTNLITDPTPGAPFNNSGTTRREGFELSFDWQNILDSEWGLNVDYTALVSEGEGLPRNMVNLDISGPVTDKMTAGISLNYLASRDYGRNRLDPATLVRLYADYEVNDSLTLTGRIENLFDDHYELYSSSGLYGSTEVGAGLGFFVGARIDW